MQYRFPDVYGITRCRTCARAGRQQERCVHLIPGLSIRNSQRFAHLTDSRESDPDSQCFLIFCGSTRTRLPRLRIDSQFALIRKLNGFARIRSAIAQPQMRIRQPSLILSDSLTHQVDLTIDYGRQGCGHDSGGPGPPFNCWGCDY